MRWILNIKHGALNIFSSKNKGCSLLSGICNTRCKKQHRSSHLLSANKRNSPKCEAMSVILLQMRLSAVMCACRKHTVHERHSTTLKLLHIRTSLFVCVRGFVPVFCDKWPQETLFLLLACLTTLSTISIFHTEVCCLNAGTERTIRPCRGSIFPLQFLIKATRWSSLSALCEGFLFNPTGSGCLNFPTHSGSSRCC